METQRWQKRVTVSNEQIAFIKSNHGKMSLSQISKMLGLSVGVVHNNMRVVGLIKPKQAKIINFDRNGYFDVDEFQKLYNY